MTSRLIVLTTYWLLNFENTVVHIHSRCTFMFPWLIVRCCGWVSVWLWTSRVSSVAGPAGSLQSWSCSSIWSSLSLLVSCAGMLDCPPAVTAVMSSMSYMCSVTILLSHIVLFLITQQYHRILIANKSHIVFQPWWTTSPPPTLPSNLKCRTGVGQFLLNTSKGLMSTECRDLSCLSVLWKLLQPELKG